MDVKKNKTVPEIKGLLRSHVVEVPSCIRDCSGIKIFGKRIKSLLSKAAFYKMHFAFYFLLSFAQFFLYA